MGGVKGDADQWRRRGWRRHVPSCSDKELKKNVRVGGDILFLGERLLAFGTVA